MLLILCLLIRAEHADVVYLIPFKIYCQFRDHEYKWQMVISVTLNGKGMRTYSLVQPVIVP